MKTIQTIVLALSFCTLTASCSNTPYKDIEFGISDKSSVTNITTELSDIKGNSEKTVTDKLNQARNAGKTVFLVVYNKLDEDKDKALKIAEEAYAKKKKATEVIELNIAGRKNLELVKRFRLAGAPMPLIMVIDKNGIPAGGLPLAQATAEALLDIIPSPKYSEVLKALNEKKAVFLIAYKESMGSRNKAVDLCNKAVKKMKNSAVIIELNMDDKSEIKLVKSLKIKTQSSEPKIYVINQQGKISGTFKASDTTGDLVKAAKKVVSSSCCPGGSKKSGC